jgi:glutamate 5-kinase
MNHRRSLNLKNMLHVLIELGVVPVINENDSVSFEEITVGDNDQLAAMVAVLLEVEALVMITTPDGLYQQDPVAGVGAAPQGIAHPQRIAHSQRIAHVAYGDPLLQVSLAGKSAAGRGGMSTKLEAVHKVTPFGIPVVIATSRAPNPIVRALTTPCGTFFSPSILHPLKPLQMREAANQRKKKLTTMAKLNAEVVVDQGAAAALKGQKSLLPSGIVKVVGQFKRGDSVKIVYQKSILAVGLAEYSAQDLRAIKGKQSDEIEGILGFCTAKVAFHRNNLYWLQE